jgi:hypothetical protein
VWAGLATHYNVSVDTLTPLASKVTWSAEKTGELVVTITDAAAGVSELRSTKGFEVPAPWIQFSLASVILNNESELTGIYYRNS